MPPCMMVIWSFLSFISALRFSRRKFSVSIRSEKMTKRSSAAFFQPKVLLFSNSTMSLYLLKLSGVIKLSFPCNVFNASTSSTISSSGLSACLNSVCSSVKRLMRSLTESKQAAGLENRLFCRVTRNNTAGLPFSYSPARVNGTSSKAS